MADTTTFFIDLFLLLTSAVVAGELATRLGQTALVGQLLVGVALGATLLGPYIGLSTLGAELSALQFLGTVFILFMAGLDVVPEQISRMGLRTALGGVAIFAVPFVVLSGVAELLVPSPDRLLPLFLGLTLSITALPVMGIMLMEFGLLQKPVGRFLINTALVNELVAVSVFAVLLQLQKGTAVGPVAIGMAALAVGIFLSVMLLVHWLLRWLGNSQQWLAMRARFAQGLRTKEAGFAILMIGVIGASLFSQYLGLTFVVGAFYAGILVTRKSAGAVAHRSISGIFDAMTWGFFIPLFFAFAGVQMNLRLLDSPWLLFIFGIFVAIAILSKVTTGYSIARLRRWSSTDALAIGHLVSSRGAVELAMAVILLGDGVFTTQIYTIVAGVGLVTTLIAPVAVRRTWKGAHPGGSVVTESPAPHEPASFASDGSLTPTLTFGTVAFTESEPLREGDSEPTPDVSPRAEDSSEAGQDRPPLPLPRRK